MQALQVLLQIAPQFDLQMGEAASQVFPRLVQGGIHRFDADGDGRGQRLVAASQEIDKGDAQLLREEVMEGHVQGRPGGRRGIQLSAHHGTQASQMATVLTLQHEAAVGQRLAAGLRRFAGDRPRR